MQEAIQGLQRKAIQFMQQVHNHTLRPRTLASVTLGLVLVGGLPGCGSDQTTDTSLHQLNSEGATGFEVRGLVPEVGSDPALRTPGIRVMSMAEAGSSGELANELGQVAVHQAEVEKLQTAAGDVVRALVQTPGLASLTASRLRGEEDPLKLEGAEELLASLQQCEDRDEALLVALSLLGQELTEEGLFNLQLSSAARARNTRSSSLDRRVALDVLVRSTKELMSRTEGANPGSMLGGTASGPQRVALDELRALAVDECAPEELRIDAVMGLGALRCRETSSLLASIAGGGFGSASLALRRAALVGVFRLDESMAINLASEFMAETSEMQLYETAAIILGQAATPETLTTLLEHADRGPVDSRCLRAAIRFHLEWIEEVLKRGDSEYLTLVLRALPYIQDSREDLFLPDLLLLVQSDRVSLDGGIGYHLLDSIKRARPSAEEARRVLDAVASHRINAEIEYPKQYRYLDLLARSVPLVSIVVEEGM